MPEYREGNEAVVRASAMFAATAVTRLVAVLREAGVIDDYLIGELGAIAEECAATAGDPQARQAMEVLRSEIGAPSRAEMLRQEALDDADEADEAASDEEDEADDGEEDEEERRR